MENSTIKDVIDGLHQGSVGHAPGSFDNTQEGPTPPDEILTFVKEIAGDVVNGLFQGTTGVSRE